MEALRESAPHLSPSVWYCWQSVPGIPGLAAPLSTSVSLHLVFSVHVSVFSYKYGDGGLGSILIHYALILINYICKDPLSKYRSCSEFLGRHDFGGEDTTQPVHFTNLPQSTLQIFIPPSLPKEKKINSVLHEGDTRENIL